MLNRLLVVIALSFGACSESNEGEPNAIPYPPFHLSAPELRSQIEDGGFECRIEGGELYPQAYACARNDSVSTYIYANDRAQIEGIRVFGPMFSRDSWIQETLNLVFTEADVVHLTTSLLKIEEPEIEFRFQSYVIELVHESNSGRAILRISQLSAIQDKT